MVYFQLGLVALFAWVGYREAANFRRDQGISPWNLSPVIWAVLVGMSLLIGGVLILIAKRTTSIPQAPARAPSQAWPGAGLPAAPASTSSLFGPTSDAPPPATSADHGAVFRPAPTILPPS